MSYVSYIIMYFGCKGCTSIKHGSVRQCRQRRLGIRNLFKHWIKWFLHRQSFDCKRRVGPTLNLSVLQGYPSTETGTAIQQAGALPSIYIRVAPSYVMANSGIPVVNAFIATITPRITEKYLRTVQGVFRQCMYAVTLANAYLTELNVNFVQIKPTIQDSQMKKHIVAISQRKLKVALY